MPEIERDAVVADPVRVQLKRVKGWRMPPNTVKVDRSHWAGNPYRVLKLHDFYTVRNHRNSPAGGVFETRAEAVAYSLAKFRAMVEEFPGPLEALRGQNLACWCRLDESCHADILLELANQ